MEGGATLAGICPSLPADLPKSARAREAGQVQVLGETLVEPEESERGLPLSQHLRSASGRK